ncbi:Coagulation factor VIII [Exaiptasia diaphana]|nr:Coagulation factor VIII [Exaiptasia diaphana]
MLTAEVSEHSPCSPTFTQNSFVLKNHVIQELRSQTQIYCEEKCASHNECYSINFYPKHHKCELSKETHFTRPIDLTHDSDGVYTHVVNHQRPMNACSDLYCSTNHVCLAKDDGKDYECKDCTTPLGMQSNAIPNSAITASSTLSNKHSSWNARLHKQESKNPDGTQNLAVWCPAVKQAGEYLQIDMGRPVSLKQVATQGRPSYGFNQYVKKYRLSYKRLDTQWMDYRESGIIKVFGGNTDRNTVVTNTLREKVVAQQVRIIVMEWNQYICMRAEIYGC